ncbi:hypothetical protein [Cryptosporangium aurantiacum]|uniref:Uncharacterized protein n=1 Tax=Cryptosporangium aurantiacum TaxID=134849 RepID=A0A1M7NMR8_9ACTN|nr:hypothetical protein [Cryptosporangium aurantiacum]SHN05071.1 hypothetical protein SAMN05443668_102725 [Cryptosporangium aurantiacum]
MNSRFWLRPVGPMSRRYWLVSLVLILAFALAMWNEHVHGPWAWQTWTTVFLVAGGARLVHLWADDTEPSDEP